MKNIVNYIFEQMIDGQVKNLKAIYNVEPEKVIFQVPVGYSESDIQIYIGDRFLPELPADEKVGKERFGINMDNVDDAYFEYNSFEVLEDFHGEYDFEWDSSFDNQEKSPEFMYAQITGLRYIILFDSFNIKKNEGEDVKALIEKIFVATESNDANKYPLTIKFNIKETEFKEV